jgi:hypothetical protein
MLKMIGEAWCSENRDTSLRNRQLFAGVESL